MTYQGHVEKGVVIFDEPVSLPDGTEVLVEATASPAADFWQSSTLDELARRQQVKAPADLEDMLGGWPEEELNDGFELEFARWRAAELEQDL